MKWIKESKTLNKIESKISKEKPTSIPPVGQKWAWSNDDQEWILVTASIENPFKIGDSICLLNENEITGKVVGIHGEFLKIDLGTIPRKISRYHYSKLILADDIAELPKKTVEDKQVSFAEYMRKREAARKILAIILDKIKFIGIKKEMPITTDKESDMQPVFNINASVRKKGTILTGKITDIKNDNSITVKWNNGNETTNWLLELERV